MNNKLLESLLTKYNLDIDSVKNLSEELSEGDPLSLRNLIYCTLDIAADNFKMNVMNFIEENKLEEQTTISCISDISVEIDTDKGIIEGPLSMISVEDISEENIKLFIEKFSGFKC